MAMGNVSMTKSRRKVERDSAYLESGVLGFHILVWLMGSLIPNSEGNVNKRIESIREMSI